MLVMVAAIAVFDVASVAFLKRNSVDFLQARDERKAPVVALDTAISWREHAPGALHGWFPPESAGAWSSGPEASFAMRLAEAPAGDLMLVAKVAGLVEPHRLPVRHVDVFINRVRAGEWVLDGSGIVSRTVRIERHLVASDNVIRVDFRFREVTSPMALELGLDPRKVSMLMVEWQLRNVTAEPSS
jgi:hypothetical protein